MTTLPTIQKMKANRCVAVQLEDTHVKCMHNQGFNLTYPAEVVYPVFTCRQQLLAARSAHIRLCHEKVLSSYMRGSCPQRGQAQGHEKQPESGSSSGYTWGTL